MAISPTFCLWFHLAMEVSMTKPYWSGSHLALWLCQSTGIQSLQLRPCPSLTCPVKPFMPVAASVHPVPIYFVALHPDAAHPTCCSRLHTCCQPKKIWLVAIPCTEGGRRWVRMQVGIWSVSTRTSGLRDFAICDVLEDNKSSMLACAQNVVCDGWARSLHCYQNMEVHSCTTAVVVTPCFHLTGLASYFQPPSAKYPTKQNGWRKWMYAKPHLGSWATLLSSVSISKVKACLCYCDGNNPRETWLFHAFSTCDMTAKFDATLHRYTK